LVLGFASGGADAQDNVEEEETKEEAFERVFGEDQPPIPAGDYPLLVDGRNVASIRARPGRPDDPVRVSRQPLLEVLEGILRPDAYAALSADGSQGRWLRLDQLRDQGIDATFDRQRLAIELSVPAAKRQRRTVRLGGAQRSPDEGREPADAAFFLNVGTTAQLVQKSEAEEAGAQTPRFDLDGSVNVEGLVLTGDATVDTQRERTVQRGFVTATRDFEDQVVRTQAGDIIPETAGFQAAPASGGFRVGRAFDIKPFQEFRPIGQRDFRIQRRSEVEVLVNGVVQDVFTLPPGRYRLQDLPLEANTANQVRLRITDEFGDTRVLSFPIFFTNALLAPGVTDFEIAGGLPRTRGPEGRVRYQRDRAFLTGFVRHGILENLTLGANAQSDRNVHQLGLDGTWATRIGTLSGDAAVSFGDASDGWAATGQYTIFEPFGQDVGRSLDLRLTSRSDNFAAVGARDPVNPVAVTASARYSQDLGPVNASLTGTYGARRDDQPDSYSASVNVASNLGPAAVSANLTYTREDGGSEVQAFISFSVPLGDRSGLRASYSSRNARVRSSVFGSTGRGLGRVDYDVTAARARDSDRVEGTVDVTTNRADFRVRQQVENVDTAGAVTRAEAVVSAQTAIVGAGDTIALSRPVSDSFAIVSPAADAPDYDLALNPSRFAGERSVEARSDFFGPPVLANLNAYIPASVDVTAPDAPLGASLGGQSFTLAPTLNSGFDIEVGSARNVAVIGTLVRPDGTPVSRRAGTAALEDGNETIDFFTNEAGRYFLRGLRSGRTYTLNVAGVPGTAELSVPDDTVGQIRVDQTRLER
jgi:outer membrane usher protein